MNSKQKLKEKIKKIYNLYFSIYKGSTTKDWEQWLDDRRAFKSNGWVMLAEFILKIAIVCLTMFFVDRYFLSDWVLIEKLLLVILVVFIFK